MKNIYENLSFSDKSNVIYPQKINDSVFAKEKYTNYLKSNSNFSEISLTERIKQNNQSQIHENSISMRFETTLTSECSDYTHLNPIAIRSALKLKESDIAESFDNISIKSLGHMVDENKENFSEPLKIVDDTDIKNLYKPEFSIYDSVKIIDDSLIYQEIPHFQKDYTEANSKYHLHYISNGKRYAATGIIEDGVFKWYLNYDFQKSQEVKIDYIGGKEEKFSSSNFSSTNNICLIYAKSNLFTESNKITVKLLPLSLNGTPINKIKIDLNQNFINPIHVKYNFNPLITSGNGYTFKGNTIKTYSEESIVRGVISFSEKKYIRRISDNGLYSLSLSVSIENHIENTNLYRFTSLYLNKESNNLSYKLLPYKYDNEEYELNRNEMKDSIECLECIWGIKGIGEWRNIVLTIDNDYNTNFGNEIEVIPLSYRYDCNTGWEGTNKENTYEEIVSNISGFIELEEGHEWGIGESDGIIEYSVDGITWFTNCRGLKGKSLSWRSVGNLSYLIIWKNNNKEIVYSNSGNLDINVSEFGGICFERGKKLKVRIDNEDWINIKSGDELNNKSFKNIEWNYDGDKLIFIKDLFESYEIESSDIENQGFHYGRIGVYTNGLCCNNFYRLFGINDENCESITLNPVFSWSGDEDIYAVDFRGVSYEENYYECGNIKLNHSLKEIGTREYENVFDLNGFEINNVGFVEYREYSGNKEIEIFGGDIISIYLYDSIGNEFVLTYDEKKLDNDNILIKFHTRDEIIWEGVKVIVLYHVNKWSETRFRSDLEIFNITDDKSNNIALNTVKTPLKAYLYNYNNEEVQFPILISGNEIKIDLSEMDKTYEGLKKVVVLVKGDLDSQGTIIQKFKLDNELNTYYSPVVSIYKNKYLPNKIDLEAKKVFTDFPYNVRYTPTYIICTEDIQGNNKVLSKVWINSTRKFNSDCNNFKTFISCSDDLRCWSNWKEFNEDFDLCEYGKFFKIKFKTFTIKENNDEITDLNFAFENLDIAKKTNDGIVYYSPLSELNKDTLYMIRIKSYNGVNYSSWSNAECYLTGNEDLNDEAKDLNVSVNQYRQVEQIEFDWTGNQDVLFYDKTTDIYNKTANGTELIKGKKYYWQVKDKDSKNAESSFAMNIKPPTPTFD